MNTKPRRPFWITALQAWLATTGAVAIGIWLAWQAHADIGGAWLGPFYLMADGAAENRIAGVLLSLGCIGMIAAGIRYLPRWWAIVLITVGVLGWLFWGVVGAGIGC